MNVFYNKQDIDLEIFKNKNKFIEILFDDFKNSIIKINHAYENYEENHHQYIK